MGGDSGGGFKLLLIGGGGGGGVEYNRVCRWRGNDLGRECDRSEC